METLRLEKIIAGRVRVVWLQGYLETLERRHGKVPDDIKAAIEERIAEIENK